MSRSSWSATVRSFQHALHVGLPFREANAWLRQWRDRREVPTSWRRALECELEAAIIARVAIATLEMGDVGYQRWLALLHEARREDGSMDCAAFFGWEALCAGVGSMEWSARVISREPVGAPWSLDRLAHRIHSVWTIRAFINAMDLLDTRPITSGLKRTLRTRCLERGERVILVHPREQFLRRLAALYRDDAATPDAIDALAADQTLATRGAHDLVEDLLAGEISHTELTETALRERLSTERVVESMLTAMRSLGPSPR
jgi:hypothetical protein